MTDTYTLLFEADNVQGLERELVELKASR